MYDDTRMKVFQCDLTQDELSAIIPPDSIDIVLLLFVLSSITPDKMMSVLTNIIKVSSCVGMLMANYEHTVGPYVIIMDTFVQS